MSLVFAGIAPHPPLLIPNIGRKTALKAEKTSEALKKIEEDLYVSKPELILVITPHGDVFPDSFSINIAHEYETDLKDFGDLMTHKKYKGDMGFAGRIQSECEQENLPLNIIHEKKLDYGTSIPLYFLTEHLTDIPVLPIGYSGLDFKTHQKFGNILKKEINRTNKRIAVIASGDLSHALTSDSPAGFTPEGQEFDDKIQELLKEKSLSGMLQLEPELIKKSSACGFRSFLILLSILQNVNAVYKQYSYEAPFGVGYLVANFEF